MKRTVSALTLITALLFSAVAGAMFVNMAYGQGPVIYSINADGTITPSTSLIISLGNVYSFTGNVKGCIDVFASNIILDGNGFTLSGGLSLNDVSNLTVKGFAITGGAELQNGIIGVLLNNASNITITNNTIFGIWDIQALNAVEYIGLVVEGGANNIITGNNLVNNVMGMRFRDTAHNLIVKNNMTCGTNSLNLYSDPGGIFFVNSSNNTIYWNNFAISVGGQAGGLNSVNCWDNGYPSGGNFWSDYLMRYSNAKIIDESGVGNVSYVIDSANVDRYPLMEPFNSTAYLLETTSPKISVLSPLNQMYNESSVPLLFTVDKLVNWTGYSLDGKDNVTVAGNFTLSGLLAGVHNITVYARVDNGNIGASETITFTIDTLPEPEPFPTTSIVLLGVSACIIGAGLMVYLKKHKHRASAFL